VAAGRRETRRAQRRRRQPREGRLGRHEAAFQAAFTALLEFVRAGDRVPDDELHDSDAILPPDDSTLAELRELISGDGLIPG